MTSSAQLRIARLAAMPALHRAFHWLHLHQPQLRKWQLELLRIPAPPFAEQARAAWFLERFQQLGLANPHIDAAGNALAELPGTDPRTSPCVLLSAHLDTVFPAGTPIEPAEIDTRILAPGACDNAAGLSALLGLAAALRHAGFAPAVPILIAANVGEEGEGDLRGMRHLFDSSSDSEASPYSLRIAAAIALEGGGSSAVVTRALASRRFRVTVTGPGGHSWTDAGAPNPILILARALLALESLDLPHAIPRTTLNIGQISGGTSINSIPESATAWLDLRSADPAQLAAAEAALRQSLGEWVTQYLPSATPANASIPALSIETIGDRPGGALPDDSPLLATLRAVDRHLNLRTETGLGSTDANIPLSLGIPAIAIGSGGLGGGIHTLQEWYDPTGRNAALRRILLTLLDTAHLAAQTISL
jgi:tripeptide aminopeptidase